MALIEKNITKKSDDYREIGEFIKRMFPKVELMPMWLICLLAKNKNREFTAFYDEEREDLFVGIMYTIKSKEGGVFVFYLAVNDKVHSKGYGSKLLQSLFAKYENIPVTLFIETLDPTAKNYEQRVKRLAFYERNGFINSGIKYGIKKPFIDVLTTDKDFNAKKCKKMFRIMPMKMLVTVDNEENKISNTKEC